MINPLEERAMSRVTMLLLVVALFGGHDSSIIHGESASNLHGTYASEGIDFDGSRYRGTVVLAKHGDIYYVQWRFGSRLSALGIGIVTNDMLAVSYYGRSIGVALYEIDGTRLVGRWAESGSPGTVFHETLTRMPDAPPRREPGLESPIRSDSAADRELTTRYPHVAIGREERGRRRGNP
jgi:hypothetical protein